MLVANGAGAATKAKSLDIGNVVRFGAFLAKFHVDISSDPLRVRVYILYTLFSVGYITFQMISWIFLRRTA